MHTRRQTLTGFLGVLVAGRPRVRRRVACVSTCNGQRAGKGSGAASPVKRARERGVEVSERRAECEAGTYVDANALDDGDAARTKLRGLCGGVSR